jgi:hypothetical protein
MFSAVVWDFGKHIYAIIFKVLINSKPCSKMEKVMTAIVKSKRVHDLFTGMCIVATVFGK